MDEEHWNSMAPCCCMHELVENMLKTFRSNVWLTLWVFYLKCTSKSNYCSTSLPHNLINMGRKPTMENRLNNNLWLIIYGSVCEKSQFSKVKWYIIVPERTHFKMMGWEWLQHEHRSPSACPLNDPEWLYGFISTAAFRKLHTAVNSTNDIPCSDTVL